jgi:hypothetical protein
MGRRREIVAIVLRDAPVGSKRLPTADVAAAAPTAVAPGFAAPLCCRPAVPEGFTVRSEGKASILQSGNDVFFNPAQVINRDMSLSGEAQQPASVAGGFWGC